MTTPAPAERVGEEGTYPSFPSPASAQAAAASAIRRWCGWHVAPVIVEDIVLDGTRGHLAIPTLRLLEIQEASIDGRPVDVDELHFSTNGIIERPGGWCAKRRGIRMTIRHGWSDTSDIGQLVTQIATRAEATLSGVIRDQVGMVSRSYATIDGVGAGLALMSHEKDALAQYRIPRSQ